MKTEHQIKREKEQDCGSLRTTPLNLAEVSFGLFCLLSITMEQKTVTKYTELFSGAPEDNIKL